MIQIKPEKEQVDEMINEGLGAGKIDDDQDKKQLENPISKKSTNPNKDKSSNTMTTNMEDVKKLGKEMEQMQTNKKIKKEGLTPDPVQKEDR